MTTGHIFLSYCSDDKRFAEDLVRGLESGGLRIWYAPRDVRPGIDYSEQIQAAIESAGAFVVIISEASNQSDFVRAETEMAFSRRRPIFPLRIAQVAPAAGLALFLQLRHWTDAFGPGCQNATARLGDELIRLTQSRNLRRGKQSLFRRNRALPRHGAQISSAGRSRAVLLLMISGCSALILFVFLLLQADSRSSAQAQSDAAGTSASNAATPAPVPNTGEPNYDPVVASWIRYVQETTPPPDENLAMDNGTSSGPGAGTSANTADLGKDINGM